MWRSAVGVKDHAADLVGATTDRDGHPDGVAGQLPVRVLAGRCGQQPSAAQVEHLGPVSYTHLTLPTNREV